MTTQAQTTTTPTVPPPATGAHGNWNQLSVVKAFLGAREVRLYGLPRMFLIGGVPADHVLLVSFDEASPMGDLHGRSALVIPSTKDAAILAWPPNEFTKLGSTDLDERLDCILKAVSAAMAAARAPQ